MDEDVEAILNASDSEDDENLNVQGVSLEDILREDDGGYIDTDGDDVAISNPPHLSRQVGFASRSSRRRTQHLPWLKSSAEQHCNTVVSTVVNSSGAVPCLSCK